MINIADSVSLEDVSAYCTEEEDGLRHQQRNYPVIRDISRLELTNIMMDNSLTRKLFPGNAIMSGVEFMVPSMENCNEYVLFEGDKLYSVPQKGTTALGSCEFIPNPTSLTMWLNIHGLLTPDVAVAFFLHFLPKSIKYIQKHTHMRIVLHSVHKLDVSHTRKLMQDIPIYQENLGRPNQIGIVMEDSVLHCNI